LTTQEILIQPFASQEGVTAILLGAGASGLVGLLIIGYFLWTDRAKYKKTGRMPNRAPRKKRKTHSR
jgi:uncharacterized iron-regulated membrane protein